MMPVSLNFESRLSTIYRVVYNLCDKLQEIGSWVEIREKPTNMGPIPICFLGIIKICFLKFST